MDNEKNKIHTFIHNESNLKTKIVLPSLAFKQRPIGKQQCQDRLILFILFIIMKQAEAGHQFLVFIKQQQHNTV